MDILQSKQETFDMDAGGQPGFCNFVGEEKSASFQIHKFL